MKLSSHTANDRADGGDALQARNDRAEMPYVLDAPAGWENGMLIRAATDILENADLISERENNKTAEFRRLAERDGSLAAELALKD